MAKKMPVGTIRSWQSGEVIKAHDNSIFGNGWYPLSTSAHLDTIGRECDSAANAMRHKKLPINGEKFLDHEIEEFEKPPGAEEGKYRPDDFKKYFGFGGAGYYSFRNEFSRRYMKPKLDAWEQINDALQEANYEKARELGNSADQATRQIFLTSAEIREIKDQIRQSIKHDDSYFTVAEANELKGIVMRTKAQLDKGVDFEGKDKQVYDKAMEVANSMPEKYEKVMVKKAQMKEAVGAVNEQFDDNWGVRESFKTYIEDKYHEYFQKYKQQIFIDEGKRQRDEFGVDIDEDLKTFYPKIGERIQNMSTKEQEEKLPFLELMEMRFEAKYGLQVKGNWNKDLLVGLQKIEQAIEYLPDGHFKTNGELKMISQEDFNGGNHGGYAWYNSGEKRINFSKEAASATGVWGRLHEGNEFEATLYHEIGHSVSFKLGRANSLKYKYFVKECGWSYSQEEAQTERGFIATGSDRDVPRAGSRQNVPLLTKYSHKSPEEAFAEYYSIYSLNKDAIDKFLKTDDIKHLEKKDYWQYPQHYGEEPKTVYELSQHLSIDNEVRQNIDRQLSIGKIEPSEHVKVQAINPWHAKIHKQDEGNYSTESIRRRKNWGPENMPPVIAIAHNNKYEIIDGVNRREQAKMNKFSLPAITVSREMYEKLTEKGFSHSNIVSYVTDFMGDSHVPLGEGGKPKQVFGIDYDGEILPATKMKQSKAIFQRMKDIFESDELQKAFDTLQLG